MNVIYESDVIWEIEHQIACAQEFNKKIGLIELNIVESLDFLDQVYALTQRGDVINDNGIYFYKTIEVKLNLR
jgi:hypothetical protein